MNNIPLINTPIHSDDYDLFVSIVNQGIDARLTGFTKSEFKQDGYRYGFFFHQDEYEILFRRLSEKETENADSWLSDLIYHCYGYTE